MWEIVAPWPASVTMLFNALITAVGGSIITGVTFFVRKVYLHEQTLQVLRSKLESMETTGDSRHIEYQGTLNQTRRELREDMRQVKSQLDSLVGHLVRAGTPGPVSPPRRPPSTDSPDAL